ncbi:MAG: hypothetical protein LQ344_003675 [Seirophora lacunosa]|nr:MAG: hypothetical protein LQ344_003675 [Seirophora lacunosa]
MDYLSLKFLNRGPDPVRNSDERLRVGSLHGTRSTAALTPRSRLQKPQSLASPASATAAPSPTSIKTSHSANSHHASPHSSIVLPNTDHLPTSFAALEGHLNHHASQLQQLADRVESINEWIELDNIVLARLIRDEEKRVEDAIAAERAFPNGETSVVPEGEAKAVPVSPTSGLPLTSPGEKWAKRSASMGDVPRSPSQIPPLPPRSDKRRKEDAINSHSGVREVRERIRAMRRSRKEFEKAVFWQRAEFWRVQERMGKGGRRESVLVGGDENSLAGAETGGLQVVGEMEREQAKKAKWSRETAGGVLPSQREWEVLFS